MSAGKGGGGRKAGKTWLGRGMDLLSLGVVFGILWGATVIAPQYRGEARILAALGSLAPRGHAPQRARRGASAFRTSAATSSRGSSPGPYVLHLIDHESVKRLEPVNTLAIALIALAGGAELRLETLKRGLRSLVFALGLHTILGIVAVGVRLLPRSARPSWHICRSPASSAPRSCGASWRSRAARRHASASSRRRAPTGPLARFSLAFVMASDVVVVVMLATAITLARPLLEPGATLSFSAFSSLGHEILGSVSLGTTLGLVLAAYLKVSGRQLLVVLIALGFGATEVLHYLNYEPLLTFMVAGFVVQNLSKQGDKFIHAIEETGGVVYVVFFASAGAHLNVPLLKDYWSTALILIVRASRGDHRHGAPRRPCSRRTSPP